MKGLELSRRYYEAFGRPMLERDFPALLPLMAVGLVGRGSERFGYDDEISRDHDFEPGFCLFLPGEDVVDRQTMFRLERAYAKLPAEFEGYARQKVAPVGGKRLGPMRTADFYRDAVGTPDGSMAADAWLRVPDYALAEATNGAVFYDGYGEFSRIREALCRMPEDVRRKRLAGNLLLMAQSGQYNFLRCLEHGEPEAAALACGEFVRASLKVIFLLEGRYCPYYKWSFRALRELPEGAVNAEPLSSLLAGDPSDPDLPMRRYDAIEAVAAEVIDRLQKQGLTEAICGDLEKHAYSVNDGIADEAMRNAHVLAAV